MRRGRLRGQRLLNEGSWGLRRWLRLRRLIRYSCSRLRNLLRLFLGLCGLRHLPGAKVFVFVPDHELPRLFVVWEYPERIVVCHQYIILVCSPWKKLIHILVSYSQWNEVLLPLSSDFDPNTALGIKAQIEKAPRAVKNQASSSR